MIEKSLLINVLPNSAFGFRLVAAKFHRLPLEKKVPWEQGVNRVVNAAKQTRDVNDISLQAKQSFSHVLLGYLILLQRKHIRWALTRAKDNSITGMLCVKAWV